MMLRNHYGVDMGTSGLILQAQSREEILADKLLAFALRPNRLKNIDIWDMIWLHQQGVVLPLPLLPLKLDDHHCNQQKFADLLSARNLALATNPDLYADFQQEIRRFLPTALVTGTVEQPAFWQYVTTTIAAECQRAFGYLMQDGKAAEFKM
jgi:hypothetical protein